MGAGCSEQFTFQLCSGSAAADGIGWWERIFLVAGPRSSAVIFKVWLGQFQGISKGSRGQTYYHNNTKILFNFFTVLTMALLVQKQRWAICESSAEI